jgi:hypothetical protein
MLTYSAHQAYEHSDEANSFQYPYKTLNSDNRNVTDSALPIIQNAGGDGPDSFKRSMFPKSIATTAIAVADSEQSSNLQTNGAVSTSLKFYIIPIPEYTTWLVENFTQQAKQFYDSVLNEETIEVWLHRAFSNFSLDQGQVMDPAEADVFLIPAYLAFRFENSGGSQHPNEFAKVVYERLYNTSKPHLFLGPSNNPQRSRVIGIHGMIKGLLQAGVNIYSVGIERNPFWQGGLEPSRILPIPYQVKPSLMKHELASATSTHRHANFCFYSGDTRKHAMSWSGCNRSMILPLQNHSSNLFDVRVYPTRPAKHRLSQDAYNHRMLTSDYCLILCGDTPTSRSLASAMIHGCIPLRIGSRLRGLCEDPCHAGFGWNSTGLAYPHLPFGQQIDWNAFPEVNEREFINSPFETLQTHVFKLFTAERKVRIRDKLREVQLGWIYGWGNPIDSNEFGAAAMYAWQSFQFMLSQVQRSAVLPVNLLLVNKVN